MDKNFITEYLEQYFDELEPKEFYRQIFQPGELAAHNERSKQGKYNAIAVELLPKEDKKVNARRYIITDELDIIDELLEKENFIIISPISYAGRSRTADRARFIYAMAIDLDGIEEESNMRDLFHQMEYNVIPTPTYIISSGNGIHLYYQFEQPIPCFKNITKQLQALKQDLTRKIWNSYITSLSDKPQIQSLFQGFRMCGGVTKNGSRTKAFETGKKVTVEYLNDFVLEEKNKVKEIVYKSNITLNEAKNKYPEWYQKRIVEKQPKGSWTCKKDLYNWWLNRIQREIVAGHRYYGIMCLAIYAKKCGVPREELEQDAFKLLERMEALTQEETNHFTREDILAALELYNDNYYTFPIDTISQLTALPIQKNKRNGRPQKQHLKRIRALQEVDYPNGEWRNKNGRGYGTKNTARIKEWRQQHPGGSIKECMNDLKLSQSTVYRHWKENGTND